MLSVLKFYDFVHKLLWIFEGLLELLLSLFYIFRADNSAGYYFSFDVLEQECVRFMTNTAFLNHFLREDTYIRHF